MFVICLQFSSVQEGSFPGCGGGDPPRSLQSSPACLGTPSCLFRTSWAFSSSSCNSRCMHQNMYSLVPIRRHVPINSHASRHWKSHNPIKRHTYKVICNGCLVVIIKGAPRSVSKLGIDPINCHASYFGKSTGSNKRSVRLIELCLLIWTRE